MMTQAIALACMTKQRVSMWATRVACTAPHSRSPGAINRNRLRVCSVMTTAYVSSSAANRTLFGASGLHVTGPFASGVTRDQYISYGPHVRERLRADCLVYARQCSLIHDIGAIRCV